MDQLVLTGAFLLFHSSVLKPDFDLRLVEAERRCYLDAPGSSEVAIKVKLFFQFSQLLVGEVGSPDVVVVVVWRL